MADFSSGGKVHNCTEEGEVPRGVWCEWCGNSGIAILEGTVTIDGHETSRGSAPCKWCDQGTRRYVEWTRPTGLRKGHDAAGKVHVAFHRQLLPATDFTMYDVLPEPAEPRAADRFVPNAEWLREREASGIARGALQLLAPRRVWPSEWLAEPAAGQLLDPVEPERPRRNDR